MVWCWGKGKDLGSSSCYKCLGIFRWVWGLGDGMVKVFKDNGNKGYNLVYV